MNKLLLYSLFLFFLGQATEITKKEGILGSHKLDSSQVYKINGGFDDLKNNECSNVHDYMIHQVLHTPNCDTRINNLEDYDRNKVFQLLRAESLMNSKANVHGNGLRGAVVGFWLSKLAVHAAAQTAYALVAGAASLVYPPAAPVVYCSLQLTFAAYVEIASNMIARGTTS